MPTLLLEYALVLLNDFSPFGLAVWPAIAEIYIYERKALVKIKNKNPTSPRFLIINPAVYSPMVSNYDFKYLSLEKSTHLTENLN